MIINEDKNTKERNKAIADLIAVEKKYLNVQTQSENVALTPAEKAQKENDVRSAYIQQYQDALASLKPQEDAINKAYEERINALDQVAQLNKEIADSQKAQLDLADALSKGDISAAAKTAADVRARAAASASLAARAAARASFTLVSAERRSFASFAAAPLSANTLASFLAFFSLIQA